MRTDEKDMVIQSWSVARTTLLHQPKLWQSREMNYNLSYRGPILVIQKPNIKFTKESTTSMKNTSPNSICFPIENQSQIEGKV